MQVELHIDEQIFHVTTHIAGVYNFENLLAAACVGNRFAVPAEHIATAIENYTPQNNRSQVLQTAHNQLLLDYYNANPTSMKEALHNFFEQIYGRKMVILGDMFELGDEAHQEHAAIIDLLLPQSELTRVVVGNNFYEAARNIPEIQAFRETEELKKWLAGNPPRNLFILVKGSRGMRLEQLIELL